MKLLLDTHIWVWSLLDPDRLSARVLRELKTPSNEFWLSPLSVWEFMMLCEKGRIVPDDGAESWVSRAVAEVPFKEALPTFEVALETRLIQLPHGDPVDRLLVATARVLDLALVTADRRLIEARSCALMANT